MLYKVAKTKLSLIHKYMFNNIYNVGCQKSTIMIPVNRSVLPECYNYNLRKLSKASCVNCFIHFS